MKLSSRRIYTFLSESALIVLSVLLALFLSELRSNVKENRLKEKALSNIRLELSNNQKIVSERIKTHKEIHNNINQLLNNGLDENIADTLFSEHLGFNIFYFTNANSLAPEFLKDVAWAAAENANIISAFPYEMVLSFSDVYNSQKLVEDRINELVKLILTDRDTLDKDQMETTLIILRDYFGEIVANEIYLNDMYNIALERMNYSKE